MKRVRAPFTDDGEVVLDTLVVYVRALFEERHGNLCIADTWGDGGHPSSEAAH